MRAYTKPEIMVERFCLSQAITSCGGIKIGFMDTNCVLADDDAPAEMKDLAGVGFFLSEGGCYDHANDGAICYNTSANMAFTS